MKIIIEYFKHIIKIIIGKKDSNYKLFILENRIHSQTWVTRKNIIEWSEKALTEIEKHENETAFLYSNDSIVTQGYKLKTDCLKHFKGKHASKKKIRILIHIPTINQTIAGHSLFNNLADGLQYIGIEVRRYYSGDTIKTILEDFKPIIFLSSDNDAYINSIDWKSILEYSKNNSLKIGLTASLEEYGNTPLISRLKRGKDLGVNFYYSFRSYKYVHTSIAYKPFYEFTQKICCIEFGANPLLFYPLPNIKRDINYVLLASSNQSKKERYVEYLSRIFTQYPGFLDGPGWINIKDFRYNKNRDRYIFARGKAGLNLHIPNQLNTASELNERTYILAMCGVPQIIDNPPLLESRFSKDSMFVASSPDNYFEVFQYLLNNPEEGEKRALLAQKEVYAKYTSFHRAEQFIADLEPIIL